MANQTRESSSPPIFIGDEDKQRVAQTLRTILLTIIIVTTVVGLVVWFFALVPTYSLLLVGMMVLGEVGLLFLVRRGHTRLVSTLLIMMMGMAFVGNALFFGGGSVFSAYVVVVLIAGLTIGGRTGLGFAGLGAVAGLVLAWLESIEMLPPSMAPITPVFMWAGNTATFVLAAVVVQMAMTSSRTALERARRNELALLESNRSLQVSRDDLTARTQELERHARYLEATAAVARDATSALNLADLLNRVVNLVSEQFGFYHTGIFLVDATGEWAELQAASSIGGQRMLERHHRLNIKEQSIVAYTVARGEARIALDTGTDAIFFDNPDLPATRSEAALPLQARGQILGVLDVQSTTPQAFTAEDMAVLQTLADQVAIAISNVQLFQQAQESLAAQQRTAAQLTQETWQALLRAQQALSVQRGVSEAEAEPQRRPEMALARQTGKPTLDEGTRMSLAAPVQVRGQVIGVLDAHKPQGAWTAEEIALIESLTEQLGVALESARLYQDTQRRAARERMISEVAGRIRETLDMEAMLRTAAEEMRRALALEDLVVLLAKSKPSRADADTP
ncbi:MAG TPA: GAF domain-containing protein [Anaerolineae bacterium]|nr:GAF domain-containing protein [Anaerolineae bacterium]